jgi:hypothetical protein
MFRALSCDLEAAGAIEFDDRNKEQQGKEEQTGTNLQFPSTDKATRRDDIQTRHTSPAG